MILQFRHANIEDIKRLSEIENACFPQAEAATIEAIEERIKVYSEGFILAQLDQTIIGFINGGATNDTEIKDEFFESMDLHDNEGRNLVIFGLDVHPDYQGRGYARQLMKSFIEFAKDNKKSSVVLTCKSHLIDFYKTFGYINLGLSDSTHGGAEWYDLVLSL